ncbi:MAG: LysR family transcriptional regulator [Pseudomonadota bacterium]
MDQLDCMRSFIAVVESGSFTAAADRLGVSKKRVSAHVSALEARLHVRLLSRTTRSVSVSDAGLSYYQGCQGILASLDDLENGLSEDNGRLTGTLRLALPVDYGRLAVLPSIAAFGWLHPDLSLDLHFSDRFVDLVAEGFDLAVRVGTLTDSTLISRAVSSTSVWVVAAPALVETHGAPEHPDDLARYPILQDANFPTESVWHFRHAGTELRFSPRARLRANSATAVRDLAVTGYGVARVPSVIVERDVAAGRLVRLLGDFELPGADIHVVYPSREHQPAKVRALIDHLRETLPGPERRGR